MAVNSPFFLLVAGSCVPISNFLRDCSWERLLIPNMMSMLPRTAETTDLLLQTRWKLYMKPIHVLHPPLTSAVLVLHRLVQHHPANNQQCARYFSDHQHQDRRCYCPVLCGAVGSLLAVAFSVLLIKRFRHPQTTNHHYNPRVNVSVDHNNGSS